MIRACSNSDLTGIAQVINDGASAYRGVIPDDRWHDPYMPDDELARQVAAGVEFWCHEENGRILGVMGIQPVRDVTLIRHAYVRTAARGNGIGTRLLDHLVDRTARPILIGTWAAATWAIRFYEKHGFRLVARDETPALLRAYWSIPERQIETSVVLADQRWRASAR